MEQKKGKCVYITTSKIPSNQANAIHVMKLSEELSRSCESFTLVLPGDSAKDRDVFGIYGVDDFNIKYIRKKRLPFLKEGHNRLLEHYSYALAAVSFAASKKADFILTRDPLVAVFATKRRIRTVFDLHGDYKVRYTGKAYSVIDERLLISPCIRLVSITKSLREYYKNKYNIDESKITVLPDGVTLKNYDFEPKKITGEPNIVYMGKFHVGKGLRLLYDIALAMPGQIFDWYGGDNKLACKELGVQALPENVRAHGYVSQDKVPEILEGADILLLPNQKDQHLASENIGNITSPIKMFEYMASGRTMISSDIEVLREVLDESLCYFADADDALTWKKAIEHIKENTDEAYRKAVSAREEVQKYTWGKRAEGILKLGL
ncbi:glycosyltransferase family 4 protein [Butyrivibrio sp. MC2021]|uniref:glycosyltransferase family 4 protein n=1 Tax=Butyrivibrio sp. MC2021 TaxID=1408306 RepID=UPI00047E10DE|nr:glycosyltransferase family 4 protein [Butyrivibrio sp. MC2021]